MRFKVLAGSHYQGNPAKRFVAGDVVESLVDLAAKFPNKFKKVESEESPKEAIKLDENGVYDVPISNGITVDGVDGEIAVIPKKRRGRPRTTFNDRNSANVTVSIPGYESFVLLCPVGKDRGRLVRKGTEIEETATLMTPDEACKYLVAQKKN